MQYSVWNRSSITCNYEHILLRVCRDGVTYVKNFSAGSCFTDCLVRHSQNSDESPERERKLPEVTQQVNGNVGTGLGILMQLLDEIKEKMHF